MEIRKNKGIIISEYVLNQLAYKTTNNEELRVSVETFYNCREQGYVLNIHNDDWTKKLYVWVYAHRNSDEPTITWTTTDLENYVDNMYSEDSWLNRTTTYNSVENVTPAILELIEKYFNVIL